jgi:hypothetical protein
VLVNLHPDFRRRLLRLSEETQQTILETLRRIEDRPELEPELKIRHAKLGDVGLIHFAEGCMLAYCVQYASGPSVLGVERRAIRIVATLTTSTDLRYIELPAG